MTLIGRIFTYILFVLAVVFFLSAAFVNAKHISYRNLVEDKSTGYKVQLAREQAKSKELTGLVEKLRDEKAIEQLGRRAALSALQTQMERLNSELQEKEKELAAKQSQVTLLTATEDLTQKELTARTKENEELRQQLVSAREDRDMQYQKFVQTYDEFVRLQGTRDTLDRQSKELARSLTAAIQKLNILGITPETKLDGPPAVNGVVTAVSSNLVEVSIGRDDGVREGDDLDVYRGAQYIGRINITRSEDDRAIGEILTSHIKGFILKGDRVDSRLSEIYVKRPSAQ